MFSQHKNSYLQLEFKLNSRIINRMIDLTLKRPSDDAHDATPPLQRLSSMVPSLYAPCINETQGYGRIGLDKLIKELDADDQMIQCRAIHSIKNLVHFPEYAIYLMSKQITGRLTDLLKHKSPLMREDTCVTLATLATYSQMEKTQRLRQNIYDIIKDEPVRRVQIQAALYLAVAIDLKDTNFTNLLIDKIRNEDREIMQLHLKTLDLLLRFDQTAALENNSFDLFLQLLSGDFKALALGCLSQLLQNREARILSDNNGLIFTLQEHINNNDRIIVLNALKCLVFALNTDYAKLKAQELFSLQKRLIELAQFQPTQLFSMTALTIMVDNPATRNLIRTEFIQEIENMKVDNIDVKDRLIRSMNRK